MRGRSDESVGGVFKNVFSLSNKNRQIQLSLFLENPQTT